MPHQQGIYASVQGLSAFIADRLCQEGRAYCKVPRARFLQGEKGMAAFVKRLLAQPQNICVKNSCVLYAAVLYVRFQYCIGVGSCGRYCWVLHFVAALQLHCVAIVQCHAACCRQPAVALCGCCAHAGFIQMYWGLTGMLWHVMVRERWQSQHVSLVHCLLAGSPGWCSAFFRHTPYVCDWLLVSSAATLVPVGLRACMTYRQS